MRIRFVGKFCKNFSYYDKEKRKEKYESGGDRNYFLHFIDMVNTLYHNEPRKGRLGEHKEFKA